MYLNTAICTSYCRFLRGRADPPRFMQDRSCYLSFTIMYPAETSVRLASQEEPCWFASQCCPWLSSSVMHTMSSFHHFIIFCPCNGLDMHPCKCRSGCMDDWQPQRLCNIFLWFYSLGQWLLLFVFCDCCWSCLCGLSDNDIRSLQHHQAICCPPVLSSSLDQAHLQKGEAVSLSISYFIQIDLPEAFQIFLTIAAASTDVWCITERTWFDLQSLLDKALKAAVMPTM